MAQDVNAGQFAGYVVIRSRSGRWLYAGGTTLPTEKGIPVGAKFVNEQTGARYNFDGTQWVAESGGGAGVDIEEADGNPSMLAALMIIVGNALSLTDMGADVGRIDVVPGDIDIATLDGFPGNPNVWLDGTGAFTAPASAPAPDNDARVLAMLAL